MRNQAPQYVLHVSRFRHYHPGRGPTARWGNIPTFPLKCPVLVPKAHAWCVRGGGEVGRTQTAHFLKLDSLLTHSVCK